jgi:hypothetical protein
MFSRSASPWPTHALVSSVFAAATPSGATPSRSSAASRLRPRWRKRKISSPPSYFLSGRKDPSLSFTATATSRALSRSQLTPIQALAMAQELLRYHPTEGGRRGGSLESPNSSPSPTKTLLWESPRCSSSRFVCGASSPGGRQHKSCSGKEGGLPRSFVAAQ